MVRVAIIGCGKIADQHIQAISRIPSSHVVAVCDREPLMASQLAERFSIEGCFSDAAEMLRTMTPDVVHITTPPQSHHSLGLQCLAAGVHVYLEKPFTVTLSEARSLIEAAAAAGLKITAGHNYQFVPEMLKMRRRVEQGFLGGPAVHVESYWSYDLGDASYVGPLLGNSDHWVRRLPGQLMHNIVSHGIARLAEFLDDDITQIVATAHQSAQLMKLGGKEIADELRVMIRDAKGTTAYFCFSTQIKPGMNTLRVCGSRNSIAVDLSCGSVIEFVGRSYKSYLTFVVPALIYARQYVGNAWRNAVDILRWRLHQDSGMKELIARFHDCLHSADGPPIPYREVLLTARIMDAVFEQIRRAPSHDDAPRIGGRISAV
jgi:predicted dehydrogenase